MPAISSTFQQETEADWNGLKQTEKHWNGQERTETNRNRQKQTVRLAKVSHKSSQDYSSLAGHKHTGTDRNGQNGGLGSLGHLFWGSKKLWQKTHIQGLICALECAPKLVCALACLLLCAPKLVWAILWVLAYAPKLACALVYALVCSLKSVCVLMCTCMCSQTCMGACMCSQTCMYGHLYVIPNLYIKNIYIYCTTLPYTMDTILPDLGIAE